MVSNRDKWTKIYCSEVTTNSDIWKPFVKLKWQLFLKDVDSTLWNLHACSSSKITFHPHFPCFSLLNYPTELT